MVQDYERCLSLTIVQAAESAVMELVSVGGRKENTISPQSNYMVILEYLLFLVIFINLNDLVTKLIWYE
jgi:hypothetical protein